MIIHGGWVIMGDMWECVTKMTLAIDDKQHRVLRTVRLRPLRQPEWPCVAEKELFSTVLTLIYPIPC